MIMKNMTLKTFSSLVLFGIISQVFTPALLCAAPRVQHQPISYSEIGQLYQSSFGIEKPKETKPKEEEKIDLAKFDFAVPRMQMHEARQQLFSAFEQSEQLWPKPVDKSFNQDDMITLVKDLELFRGSGVAGAHVFAHLVMPITLSGQVSYTTLLSRPTTDKKLLRDRQALEKKLMDEGLTAQITDLLAKIAASETALVYFWQPSEALQKRVDKQVYPPGFFAEIRQNPVIMELVTRFVNVKTLLVEIFPIGLLALNAFGQKYMDDRVQAAQDAIAAARNQIVADQRQKFVSYFVKPFKAVLGLGVMDSWKRRVLSGSIIALATFSQLYSAPAALRQFRITQDTINFMQSQLIEVASIVRTSRELLELMRDENGQLPSGWKGGTKLEQLFADAQTPQTEFDQLIADLQTKTFLPPASFFSKSGKILANHARMMEYKDSFVEILEAIGELDSYLAVAKLVKKHEKEPVHYCFAEFVESDKPYLKIDGFWHPLIGTQKAVTNDVELGKNIPANIILTGSNTGGKSTILKAILLSVLMAQTFGIAPAESMVFTPYFYLGCYLRIVDNLAGGDSLFKAEVKRAQAMVEKVLGLAKNQFALLLIDELFTGTAPEQGQAAAYKIAEHLLKNPQVNFILATHFPALTNLELEYGQLCRNFAIDIFKDDAGNLVRTFKWKPGISTQNVAWDILNSEIRDIKFGRAEQPVK